MRRLERGASFSGNVVDMEALGIFERIKGKSIIDKHLTVRQVRNALLKIFGHDCWYISGSLANPQIAQYGDIDVYFYDENVFHATHAAVVSRSGTWCIQKSNYAVTLHLPKVESPVQLICKHFGKPSEIFEKMDLNVCRQAILPCGKRVRARGAHLPVHLHTVNAASFSRLLKYHRYYDISNAETASTMLKVIDKYITDESVVEGYYSEDTQSVNQLLYRSFAKALRIRMIKSPQKEVFTPVYEYLIDRVNEHVPEMLL